MVTLFTRATPGTPASLYIKQLFVRLPFFLSFIGVRTLKISTGRFMGTLTRRLTGSLMESLNGNLLGKAGW